MLTLLAIAAIIALLIRALCVSSAQADPAFEEEGLSRDTAEGIKLLENPPRKAVRP